MIIALEATGMSWMSWVVKTKIRGRTLSETRGLNVLQARGEEIGKRHGKARGGSLDTAGKRGSGSGCKQLSQVYKYEAPMP